MWGVLDADDLDVGLFGCSECVSVTPRVGFNLGMHSKIIHNF